MPECSMRREELYLKDIIEAVEAIRKFLSEVKKSAFLTNDLVRSAVLQKLSVIGEAAARLSLKFRKSHPEIPWEDIIGFRNIAVHAYFAVDWSIVWVSATQEAPDLGRTISGILAREFPEVGGPKER
jgi:uncharacterized protein with HEPN domain